MDFTKCRTVAVVVQVLKVNTVAVVDVATVGIEVIADVRHSGVIGAIGVEERVGIVDVEGVGVTEAIVGAAKEISKSRGNEATPVVA